MKAIFNKAPLTTNTLSSLSLGAIRPEGWLRAQMEAQAKGITGKLREIWPDVGNGCAWLGGEGDSWERAPYYLDGLVSLAWGLDDEQLKASAMDYIEWILASQREDGWFGPELNDDYWPLMVCLKALYQYFTATMDKRVLPFMDKFFKYEYRNLESKPLRGWACARGGENMLAALQLYNITGQKYLLELCRILRGQTLDWPNIFHTFPNIQPMSRSLKWERLKSALHEEGDGLVGTDHPYFNTYYHQSHGVNVAMGLKTPGVINMFKSGFKEQGGFRFGWTKLMKHHGVASGIFTADEHLNGASPMQGTETCAVVEAMYSLETLIGCGDFGQDLPDILEKLAFNALPAAFTADTMGHQYDQQANQVAATAAPRPWYNNGDESNLFGLEPNFGCCTANLHQGWPKFTASLWYATNDDGLAAISYAPCKVRTAIDGVPVRLSVGGGYPFAETVEIEVAVKRPIEFPLYLRVPFWAKQPVIHLPEGEIMTVKRWRNHLHPPPLGNRRCCEAGAADGAAHHPLVSSVRRRGARPAADGLPAEGELAARGRPRRSAHVAGNHGRGVELDDSALRADEGRVRRKRGERVQGGRAAREGAREAGQGRRMENGRRQLRRDAHSAQRPARLG